jgi:hypothetical protein
MCYNMERFAWGRVKDNNGVNCSRHWEWVDLDDWSAMAEH